MHIIITTGPKSQVTSISNPPNSLNLLTNPGIGFKSFPALKFFFCDTGCVYFSHLKWECKLNLSKTNDTAVVVVDDADTTVAVVDDDAVVVVDAAADAVVVAGADADAVGLKVKYCFFELEWLFLLSFLPMLFFLFIGFT